jgi:succinate dehydrogenase / fumarate reductase, cytochrome b subunit
VATTSLTRSQQAARSTVAMKAIMAVSGLIMIAYLLAHMYGNLKVFAGQEAFDEYAHHLRTIGEPILPYSGALWVIRIVLLVAIVAHVYSAVTLWSRDRKARGGTSRYASSKGKRGMQRTYASFTLRWGGIIVLLFVIYHLLQLTFHVVGPGEGGPENSPYARVVSGSLVWWLVVVYTIALLAVGFHLRHGVWSALTSLGANTSAVTRRRLNILAYVITIVVTVGFLLVPYAILFGVVS